MFGVYQLFIPPEGVGLIYFLIWLTVFFLGATMIALPHRAWGAELSPDYHQRSRVTAAREVYVLLGLMLAAAVPMIVEIRADGGSGVGEVFTTLWNDAIGAFTGDFREKTVVDRATLTGPVLAGLASSSGHASDDVPALEPDQLEALADRVYTYLPYYSYLVRMPKALATSAAIAAATKASRGGPA